MQFLVQSGGTPIYAGKMPALPGLVPAKTSEIGRRK